MPNIFFLPDNREVHAEDGENMRDAALRGGVAIAHTCGGKGRCSTCRVFVYEGLDHCSPRTDKEQEIAARLALVPEIRLACQTSVTGSVRVRRLIIDEHDIELHSRFIIDRKSGIAGVEKHVFIMFLDIRGFTALAESLLPYDVIHILNRFFHLMDPIVRRCGGNIDSYLGDGFMALFEVDKPAEGALSAIRAGLEMLDEVSTHMTPYVKSLFGRTFEIGIGLHYGLVVAGTVGGGENMKTTVIGDAVNYASRIESANKQLGTKFLISRDACGLPGVSDRVRINRTVEIEIPGKTGLQTLYEIAGFRST